MTQSATEIATAWMAALASGDAERTIALSSPSIVYTTGQVRRYEGHDGVRDIVSDLSRLAGFLTIGVEGEILESEGVVALRRLERYTLPSGGIEIRGCSFVEVADGVVTRWADYKSMHAIDEIVG
ncbi:MULTISPECIES: nuclear transport factor 2 family protein [Dietzia]|uniref:Nuclear transport factor 2 family protein n=1 Tax=Dietzia maris TaxID=37915 RepID=A0ABT8H464_9ACTN|nr:MULTISPECIES: nuclear transport factor 2 family protein [Dietzia]MBB0990083.1 nuclear transport factor 2 family protein [Dietzia sp. SLG510A3-30A2]MBB0993515.1 nuclear transport factor 2 family protein [Dietzia sp. SLG510A3-40A3]MBB1008100.1 nuclear transport factor 2 family protein [Dietzia sp. SLG510A3-3B2-2]HBD21986.1 nuclear transport factor 2 family protein [Dietzia sp.]MBB0995766.1 nuclear transport factor 2 family protein [Dietzia maris]